MRDVRAAGDRCGTPSSAIHFPEDENTFLFLCRYRVVVMSSDSVVFFLTRDSLKSIAVKYTSVTVL